MSKGLLKQSLNAFLLVAVAAFLLVVLYSAVGQQVFPRIGHYQADIERYLREDLELDITIGKLWGEMNVLTPALHLEQLTLHTEEQESPQLFIAAIDTVLDPYQSLINLTPVFKEIRLSGVSIDLRHLAHRDASQSTPPTSTTDAADDGGVQSIVTALLLQQSVEVNGVNVITHVNGKDRTLNLEQLVIKGDGFHRLINGHISYGEQENQIKTGFRVYSEGNPYDLARFYARGVVDLPSVDFAFWLREFLGQKSIEELDASAQLSFEFKQGLLQSARLAMATTSLKVADQPQLQHLSSTVWLKQSAPKDWRVWLEQGAFTVAQQRWELQDIGLKLARQADGNRWQIFAKELDLAKSHQLLDALAFLPESAESLLSQLQPKGTLHDANVVVTTKARADTEFTFASRVENISIAPANGIPGIQNLNGVVATNKRLGRVQFESEGLELSLPQLYEQPFSFKQAQGQVEWFIEPEQIRLVGDGLSLSLADVEHVSGGFQLWLSQNEARASQLMLNLGIENAQASAHKTLVPKVLSEGLRNWLADGLQAGQIPRGNLVFFTELSETAPSPVVELYLDVADASLQYLSDWPAVTQLDGQVFIDGKRVRVAAPHGQSLGGQVRNGVVVFGEDKQQQASLWVALKAKGPAQEGLDYFTQTPLQDIVNGALDDWRLSGRQQFAMALKVPMGESDDPLTIDLTSQLDDNDLTMGSLGLTFADVTGTLGYSSQRGLYSSQLQTKLWNEPSRVVVQTDFPDGHMVTTFDIDGRLNAKGLKNWVKLGLLESLSGSAPVSGQFVLDTREGQTSGLYIQSELDGIAVNLPAPFGLKREAKRPLRFDLALAKPLTMDVVYGEQVNLVLALADAGLTGHIHLGAEAVTLPTEPGLLLTGQLGTVKTDQWLPVVQRINKANEAFDQQAQNTDTQTEKSDSPIRSIQLTVAAVQHGEQTFKDIYLDAQHSLGDWTFNLDAPVAKGVVKMPKQGQLDADLVYIHLPAPQSEDETAAAQTPATPDAETASAVEADKSSDVEADSDEDVSAVADADPLEAFDPQSLPPLHIKVGELFVGATDYGRWDVTTKPDETGALFVISNGSIKKLDMNGELYWYKKGNHHTQVRLNLLTEDVGGIQKAWRMKPAIEAQKGRGKVFIDWLGSPAAFNVASLSGEVSFKLQNGSFVDAKDAKALNAFGILNFASIGRRLRLDFRDLYTEGLAFDRFEAKMQLENGLITIVDTMQVEGPAAKFATSGTINLNTKQLNQQLSVTFPVSSTLPLVAILAGFAPPVAASIFVGERLVGDQIERFTSATYDISGPWDDPKLDLKKRFDNEIDGKKKKTFWHRMKDVFGLGKD